MTDTPRKHGRPRKPAPVVEQAPVAQEAPQAPPIQYNVAKLTAHMLAGEIHRLHQEGEDLAPVHEVSDAIRAAQALQAEPSPEPVATSEVVPNEASTEPAAPHVDEHKVTLLKAAVEAAKTSIEKPRTFAVAHYSKRGILRLAHGVEFEDGDIRIHGAHGFAGAYSDDMAELHEEATKHHGNAYHVDYTD